jgi:hypothetical protein
VVQYRWAANPSGWDEARLADEMAGLGDELHAEPAGRQGYAARGGPAGTNG